ncbi:hypothetical protein ECANGB1_542 [Enterospora canceri]|uniref:Uncharacterized protein n=1 Tax=Enterospora canceri TaxID=1081671 RepID=A0A1Y1S7X1_9MICR|nr:hypothetical protein ECANGB1_542 [Enterospora canceri]
MDYKFVAKYSNDYKIPEDSSNFFVRHKNEIYEYRLLPTKSIFKQSRKAVIAYKQNNLTFVMHEKKLEVCFEKDVKKYRSTVPIIDNNGIFLIRDKNKAFVVNESGETAFCTNKDELLYFIGNGTVYYTSEQLKIEETSEEKTKEDCDCYECKHCLPRTRKKGKSGARGFLIEDKLGRIKVYKEQSEPKIVIENRLFVYCDNALITDVVKISHRTIGERLFLIVLTANSCYVIHKNIIVRQNVAGFIEIVPERFAIHNYINEQSIYEMFVLFACFKETLFTRLNELYRDEFRPEKLLCQIIADKQNKELNKEFYANFIRSVPNKVLCKAYKLLDDKNKLELLNYIRFNDLDAEEMHMIIPYNQEHYRQFVDLCLAENKLHLAWDFLEFMRRSNKHKPLQKYLLQNGIMADESYSTMYDLQKQEIHGGR